MFTSNQLITITRMLLKSHKSKHNKNYLRNLQFVKNYLHLLRYYRFYLLWNLYKKLYKRYNAIEWHQHHTICWKIPLKSIKRRPFWHSKFYYLNSTVISYYFNCKLNVITMFIAFRLVLLVSVSPICADKIYFIALGCEKFRRNYLVVQKWEDYSLEWDELSNILSEFSCWCQNI